MYAALNSLEEGQCNNVLDKSKSCMVITAPVTYR